MTTELEKQFFSVFGIEPKIKDLTPAQILYSDIKRLEYPQITDKHYLELIVLHNIYLETRLYHLDVESLKKEILQDLIYEQQLREIKKDDVSDDMIHQVQVIFEVERC